MGLAQRFRTAALYMLGGQKAIVGLEFGADASEYRIKTDFETLSKEGYEKNAIVYACINELASSAAEAEPVVEVLTKKGWEERPDHSLKKLLDKPNPEMSGYDFWFATIMYQALAGNMFWEKERSQARRVVGLWPMRPDRVGIVATKSIPGQRVKRRIQAYTWRSGADVVQLPADDVIPFKHIHPRDDLYGLPPLAAAAREGDTDNKATDYVGSFFTNAAVPKGLLKVQGIIDEAEEKRLKDRLLDMYSARGKWHEPLILGEGSEWIELAETFRDMDFPNLRKISESRLCMVFQVPPIIVGAFVGLEKATYANYEEARKSFWQDSLMPLYRRQQETINLHLAPEYGKDVRMVWDFSGVKALQEEVGAVWTRANEAMKQGWLMVNEARDMVGLDPDPQGNVYLRPMMLMPVGFGQAAEPPQLPGAKELKSAQWPDEAKERWRRSVDLTARAWEAAFREKATELFLEEKDELVAILKREGKASKQATPYHTFLDAAIVYLLANKDGWKQAYLPLFESLLTAQAENILAAFGIAWDIQRPEVQEWLANYTIKFSASIEGTSEQKIRDIIAQAQSEGWSVTRTREAIMEEWKGFSEQRADKIARTETMRSSNYGTREAWEQAGVTRVSWYTHFDDRTCGWCETMHGNTISVTENHKSLGDEIEDKDGKIMTVTYGDVRCPPLHVYCRCIELAVVEQEA